MRRMGWAVVACLWLLPMAATAQETFEAEEGAPEEGQGLGGGEAVAGDDHATLSHTGLPQAYAPRPLTLTQGTLRLDGIFEWQRIVARGITPTGRPVVVRRNEVLTGLGAGYGILDDLEVGALVIPILLSPEVAYGDPSLYGRYRFLRGAFELGAQVSFAFPVHGDAVLEGGVPARIHVGEALRIDLGVYLPIEFLDGGAEVGFRLPVEVAFDLTHAFFLGVGTGLLIHHFDRDRMYTPLGLFAGYTFGDGAGGPLLELRGGFGWPYFFAWSADDLVDEEQWRIQLELAFFLGT